MARGPSFAALHLYHTCGSYLQQFPRFVTRGTTFSGKVFFFIHDVGSTNVENLYARLRLVGWYDTSTYEKGPFNWKDCCFRIALCAALAEGDAEVIAWVEDNQELLDRLRIKPEAKRPGPDPTLEQLQGYFEEKAAKVAERRSGRRIAQDDVMDTDGEDRRGDMMDTDWDVRRGGTEVEDSEGDELGDESSEEEFLPPPQAARSSSFFTPPNSKRGGGKAAKTVRKSRMARSCPYSPKPKPKKNSGDVEYLAKMMMECRAEDRKTFSTIHQNQMTFQGNQASMIKHLRKVDNRLVHHDTHLAHHDSRLSEHDRELGSHGKSIRSLERKNERHHAAFRKFQRKVEREMGLTRDDDDLSYTSTSS